MTYHSVKIGELVLPGAFNTAILLRAFSEKEMKSFYDSYERAKFNIKMSDPPTELQKKMAAAKKSKAVPTVTLAKEFKVKPHVVDAAVKKVAIWAYMNS